MQLIGSRDRLARRLQLLPSRAALTHFAKRGDSGELRRLVDVGATREQIDAADGDGKTALYWATMTGHDEAAATLLELSADPNKPTGEGVTPLMPRSARKTLPWRGCCCAAARTVNKGTGLGARRWISRARRLRQTGA